MPLQNRVQPDGTIVAIADRGTMMGNRGGSFHDEQRKLTARHWRSRQWICCVLAFNGRRRQVMQPRRYTELFFLDEATALAAGHRPCFECRRADAIDFARRWSMARRLESVARAAEIDRVLHAERLHHNGSKRTWQAQLGELPINTFVRLGDGFARRSATGLQAWTPAGYGRTETFGADQSLTVLTPPSIVAALAAGYTPNVHNSAQACPHDPVDISPARGWHQQ